MLPSPVLGAQPVNDGDRRDAHLRLPVSLPLIAHSNFQWDIRTYFFFLHEVGAAYGGPFLANSKGCTPAKPVRTSLLFELAVQIAAFKPTLALSVLGLVAVVVCNDPHLRGRARSPWSIAFLRSTTIGGSTVGWFAEEIGAHWAIRPSQPARYHRNRGNKWRCPVQNA
jgi:hypothetical protein